MNEEEDGVKSRSHGLSETRNSLSGGLGFKERSSVVVFQLDRISGSPEGLSVYWWMWKVAKFNTSNLSLVADRLSVLCSLVQF